MVNEESDNPKSSLAHYGKKGMKWRDRRSREVSKAHDQASSEGIVCLLRKRR